MVSDRIVFMTFKERAREARHNPPSRSIDLGFVSPMAPSTGSQCLSGSLIAAACCGAINASLWEVLDAFRDAPRLLTPTQRARRNLGASEIDP